MQNFDVSYFKLMRDLVRDGKDVTVRGGQKTRELLGYEMKLNPMQVVTSFPQRKFKLDYAFAEFLWYLAATPKVNRIGLLASMWDRLKDADGQVESNYGVYMFQSVFAPDNSSYSQFDWCMNELASDPSSRRAVIAINCDYHKHANPKDMPCTMFVQYILRDDVLHSFVRMRSNDAVYGLCNDVFTWAMMHQMMVYSLAKKTNNQKLIDNMMLDKCVYTHSSESMHVYERHFDMMHSIANDELPRKQLRVFLEPEYYSRKMLTEESPFYAFNAIGKTYEKDELSKEVNYVMGRYLNIYESDTEGGFHWKSVNRAEDFRRENGCV